MADENQMMTREQIRGVAYAFQESRILLTAHELGIFTALGGSRHSSAKICRTQSSCRPCKGRIPAAGNNFWARLLVGFAACANQAVIQAQILPVTGGDDGIGQTARLHSTPLATCHPRKSAFPH